MRQRLCSLIVVLVCLLVSIARAGSPFDKELEDKFKLIQEVSKVEARKFNAAPSVREDVEADVFIHCLAEFRKKKEMPADGLVASRVRFAYLEHFRKVTNDEKRNKKYIAAVGQPATKDPSELAAQNDETKTALQQLATTDPKVYAAGISRIAHEIKDVKEVTGSLDKKEAETVLRHIPDKRATADQRITRFKKRFKEDSSVSTALARFGAEAVGRHVWTGLILIAIVGAGMFAKSLGVFRPEVASTPAVPTAAVKESPVATSVAVHVPQYAQVEPACAAKRPPSYVSQHESIRECVHA